MAYRRPLSVLKIFLSAVALIVLGGIYFKILPLFWDFDPCFSNVWARNDVAIVQSRYESLRDLVQGNKYDAAYQFTSPNYQSENSLDRFQREMSGRVGVPEIKPESTIFVCGTHAILSINGYSRSLIYFVRFDLVKRQGQWYFDRMDALYD